MSASPGAATVVTTVAAYTLRAWFNDLERSFGSRAAARTIVVGWGLLLLAWLVVGTRQLIEVLSLDAEQAAFVAGPTAAMVIAPPAITTLMATVYSPSRTRWATCSRCCPCSGRTGSPRCAGCPPGSAS